MYLFMVLSALVGIVCVQCNYNIDDSTGFGRIFDGIGGLSGGGQHIFRGDRYSKELQACVEIPDEKYWVCDISLEFFTTDIYILASVEKATSKLLVNYSEPERTQILDYLFKPNFGASLHILKVEIGGDSQSTEGTESSHMHNATDLNYQRGYEWWLMKEAKSRNPSIKLYALSWAFPGWVGKGSGSPYTYPNLTAGYILKWVQGAKTVHGLDIDYIGIWNERPYNGTYIETLRAVLDAGGFSHIQIVAPDGGWQIADDVTTNPDLKKAFNIIGAHYPGTNSTSTAQKTGMPLWSSEDYSTFNDNTGAGCWARILNQNYVTGYMTSTISWNLIASYYPNLPFSRCGLMTAMEPWSGHYVVESPVWVSAHTTQFSSPGMAYLNHGSGVGYLDKGGSYVTLVDPANTQQVTVVIETMSHNHSQCIRPFLPPYEVSNQTAKFTLKGSIMSKVKSFHVWYTKLGFDGAESTLFKQMTDIVVDTSGDVMLLLGVDELWTLSTVSGAVKGSYSEPPQSAPFPLPYSESFTDSPLDSEAPLFVPQVGVWEVRNSTLTQPGRKTPHNKVNTQVMTEPPVYWCKTPATPINLGGNYNWSSVYVSLAVRLPSPDPLSAVFVAVRVDKSGCAVGGARGIYFWLYPNTGKFQLTTDLACTQVVLTGQARPLYPDMPATMSLLVFNNHVVGTLNQETLFTSVAPGDPSHGFVGYGTNGFFVAEFDDVFIDKVH